MSEPEKLHFATHAQLKNVIGQDLINDDTIAIVELVKNALDAGSKEVSITFAPGTHAVPDSIIVRDFGRGMSRSDIKDKWLNIAYSEKRAAPTSKILAGNKGVGRFACDRLGNTLDLYTREKGGGVFHLKINWDDFERSDAKDFQIGKVDVFLDAPSAAAIKEATGESDFRQGTLLKITTVRSSWDGPKLLALRRSLERFIDPNAAISGGTFEIYLIAPSFAEHDRTAPKAEKIGGRIENRVFQELRFRTTYVESRVSSDGKKLSTALWHNGSRVYEIVERVSYGELANTRVLLHYMNAYKKAYFRKRTGLHMVDFGSVLLFVNGFRIPPYGDRNDDWLGLDSRKVQHRDSTLGCRELLGRIEITDDKKRFRVVSNREGIVRNAAFAQLTGKDGPFFKSFRRLERFVVEGLAWDSIPEDIRKGLEDEEKIKIDESMEQYIESDEKKRRRIALEVTRLIDAKADSTVSLTVDADLVRTLTREREQEVRGTLDRLAKFTEVADPRLKRALQDVRSQFSVQQERLSRAQTELNRKARHVEKLRRVAQRSQSEVKKARETAAEQEQQLLFLKSTASIDHETLVLFHHQIAINADAAKNYLESISKGLAKDYPESPLVAVAEKAVLAITKVISITQLSTKANFRLRTQKLTTDLVAFVKQYIETVAKEFSAANLSVSVESSGAGPFVLQFKPIDIAIIFDNLASNATRAEAHRMDVVIQRVSDNELGIRVTDDGLGLDKTITRPESVFERGVSTTRGSGLGLYHVKQAIEAMGGRISLSLPEGKGFGVTLRIIK